MAQVSGTNTYNSKSNKYLNTQRAHGMEHYTQSNGDLASHLAITTTNVSIYSNNQRIGFVQSFTPSEQREITPVQELGTEGVVQMVPGNTRGGTIQINRFALYNSDLWNALGLTPTGKFTIKDDFIADTAFTKSQDSGTYGNPFRTLKDQRVPLELRAETQMAASKSSVNYYNILVETYFDCWLSNYSKTINANNIIVAETASIEYSDMISQVKTNQTTFYNN